MVSNGLELSSNYSFTNCTWYGSWKPSFYFFLDGGGGSEPAIKSILRGITKFKMVEKEEGTIRLLCINS